MFFLNNQKFEKDDFIMDCKQALARKDQSNEIKTHNEFLFETTLKYNKIKSTFEEFDPCIFESKLRIDTMFYNKLLKNLDETHLPAIEKLVIDIYGTVKNIYEFVNVKPEIYKDLTPSFLNLNESESEAIVHNYIYEFLDNEYYNLPLQKRYDRYFNNCKDFAADLIQEGVSPNTAIVHTLKTALMETFLKKITFPFVYPYIKSMCEDIDFGIVFDQEKLVDNVTLFENKIHKMARIIAECI